MKFEAFFYAVEIADTGSFSQAARNLYLSQPNLSYAIKQLEEEMGVQLFTRLPGGVTVTPEGQNLIERFRVMRREYDQVQEFVATPHQKRTSLRIGSLSSSRAAAAFVCFANRYVGTPIQFSFQNFDSLDTLIAEVVGNRVELAVFGVYSSYIKMARAKAMNAALEYHALGQSTLCAVVGSGNPLYERQGSIRMEELYPYTAVQYGPTSKDPSHSMLHETGLSLHSMGEISVNGSQIFFELIRSGQAVGLVAASPDSFRKYNSAQDLRLLPIEDCDLQAEYVWMKHKNVPLSPFAEEFLSILKELY